MKISPIHRIPTHIISGFLGAGKTTLLKSLLAQKSENEVWAVVMNEFGQIGVDQLLLVNEDGYAVRELLGGCLCCSSQLSMQVTLSRLLSDTKPHRIFIEPTGLGHPAQIIEQLTEPHWQTRLDVRSPVTVVDGSRLNESEWVQQNLYQDQLKAAQIIVVSHQDLMNEQDSNALELLKVEYQAYAQEWLMASQGNIQLQDIDFSFKGTQRKIQPLLSIQKTFASDQIVPEIKQLPYHYIETAQGYSVAGWKFSKRLQFHFYDVLDLLCEQQDWLRIKAIFYTDQGWKAFNFNPEQFNYQTTDESIDNRIEIIYRGERDWSEFEAQLLSYQISKS